VAAKDDAAPDGFSLGTLKWKAKFSSIFQMFAAGPWQLL